MEKFLRSEVRGLQFPFKFDKIIVKKGSLQFPIRLRLAIRKKKLKVEADNELQMYYFY